MKKIYICCFILLLLLVFNSCSNRMDLMKIESQIHYNKYGIQNLYKVPNIKYVSKEDIMSPRCVKCQGYFHPDYSVIVDEFTNACKCVFCYTEKKEVTIADEDGKPDYIITKQEAQERYKRYIQDLKESDKIAKILTRDDGNKLR